MSISLPSNLKIKGKTYRLETLLGKGSFGEVYLAIVEGREVVVKKISNVLDKDGDNLMGVRNEIKILRWLTKYFQDRLPFAQLIDHSLTQTKTNFTAYLILEYIEGPSLQQFYHQFMERMPLKEKWILVKQISEQILEALIIMHQFNIVHRDIKLENFIMMPKSGETNFQVVFIDFGLSCITHPEFIQEERPEEIHCENRVVGSYHSVSPQIIETSLGLKRVSFNDLKYADIWSFGVAIFYLLYGRNPFGGSGPRELFTNIRDFKNSESRLQQYLTKSETPFTDILKLIFTSLEERVTASALIEHFKRFDFDVRPITPSAPLPSPKKKQK